MAKRTEQKPPDNLERRVVSVQRCELRDADADGKPRIFHGEAAVFGVLSEDLGGFKERIAAACFDASLASPSSDVRFLLNHNPTLILGRTKAGTVDLAVDATSLKVKGPLPNTSYARDLQVSMDRGDVDAMSYGFVAIDEAWTDIDEESGLPIRDLLVADLYDVSVVTFPAYPQTSAEVRAKAAEFITEDEFKTKDAARASAAIAETVVVVNVDTSQVDEAIEKVEQLAELAERNDPKAIEERARNERRYTRIAQVIGETPWAILPKTLALIMQIVGERIAGEKPTDEEIRERIGNARARTDDGEGDLITEIEDANPDKESKNGSIEVLGLYGPIFPRANLMTQVSGATSVQDFQQSFRKALADPNVSAILLDVDSPGGVVDLVPELAAEIFAARETKKIVAIANTLAASAAYWIASAASELVVTPSGEVGSIGVYCTHEDWSGAYEKEGIDVTLISAGKYKTEGNPFEPLTDAAKAAIQATIDSYYGMFVAAVAKGRGVSTSTVQTSFGQGRVVTAKKALAAGMVDRVETFEQTLARLAGKGRAPRRDLRSFPDTAFDSREELREALGLEDSGQLEIEQYRDRLHLLELS